MKAFETLTFWKRLLLSLLSAGLLSCGWTGLSGLPSLVGLVPLLIISDGYSTSSRDAWRMAGWTAFTGIVWNAATIWWVANAAFIGVVAGTFFTVWWTTLAFMAYHIVSKHGPKALASVLFVTGWIACEHIYHEAPALSFPWLQLGNGFANDVRAIQWYEYTGVTGGSLWVTVTSLVAFSAIRLGRRSGWIALASVVMVPIAVSLGIYFSTSSDGSRETDGRTAVVSVVQPSIDCYDKFNTSSSAQQEMLLRMIGACPDSAQFILLPETSLAEYLHEESLTESDIIRRIASVLSGRGASATVLAGCESIRTYPKGVSTPTSRHGFGYDYDIYNSAIAVDSAMQVRLHRKSRLVVGVETLPAWLRRIRFGEVDLGGTFGQLGIGDTLRPFEYGGVSFSPAICYEGIYDNTMAEFVRNGADVEFVVSNDGWWGDTPGHRYLFAFCRLRAIETRRTVCRSANTGVSGFISPRGDDLGRMEWFERGTLTRRVYLSSERTFYTRYGDILSRVSMLVAGLCILYFIAYRAKRKFNLD